MPQENGSILVKIQCPGCGRKLDVTDLEAFTTHPCPHCGMKFKVPKWFLNNILLEDEISISPNVKIYRSLEPTLDREAAVKILKEGEEYSHEKLEAFLAAVKRQAQLNHTGIASVYGCGVTDEGAYAVTQYACKRDWPESALNDNVALCQLAIETLGALEAAQVNGVSHGGITPSNILFGVEDEVLVTDFGVAVALEKQPGPYSSPERLEGREASYAGDVFSLGVCLYQLATGKMPGNIGEEDWRKGGAEVPAVNALNPGMPRMTSDCIMAMLAMNPMKRPKSYSEQIKQFKAAKKQKTFMPSRPCAKDDATDEHAPKTAHSSNILNILLVAGVCLLAFLGFAYWKMTQAPSNAKPVPVQTPAMEKKNEAGAKGSAEQGAEGAPGQSATLDEEVLAARPRPADLDLKAVREEIKKYMQLVPEGHRELERERVRCVGSALDYLTMCMKFGAYDRGADGVIQLRNGKSIKGVIPYAPKDGAFTVRPPNGGDSARIKLADVDFMQLMDMFQYYAEKREEMSTSKRLPAEVKDEIYNAYFNMALLCDWYGKAEEVPKYSALALKYQPGKRSELQRFGLPVPKLLKE